VHAKAYAEQTVKNAQALGKAVDEAGVKVEAGEFGYTQSHQIAVNVSQHGGGVKAAQALEANDIIVNYNMLPWDTDPRNPSGLRIGVPEMTRYGMKEADMQRLGDLIAAAVKGKTVKDEVNRLRGEFLELQYV
jgi:glycine hydroxymethyltransferase